MPFEPAMFESIIVLHFQHADCTLFFFPIRHFFESYFLLFYTCNLLMWYCTDDILVSLPNVNFTLIFLLLKWSDEAIVLWLDPRFVIDQLWDFLSSDVYGLNYIFFDWYYSVNIVIGLNLAYYELIFLLFKWSNETVVFGLDPRFEIVHQRCNK